MKLSFILILIFLMQFVYATPIVNCASYCCPKGYRYLTSTDPENVACIAGICTSSVCCYVPTCASSIGYWGNCRNTTLYQGIKRNADAIQCPNSGCNAQTCCIAV
jgi:hypothetical protein